MYICKREGEGGRRREERRGGGKERGEGKGEEGGGVGRDRFVVPAKINR